MKKEYFVLLFIYLFFSQFNQAQNNQAAGFGVRLSDVFTVLSPMPDSNVIDGELFVLVKYINTVEITNAGLKVMIDNKYVTNFVRVANHKISLIYPLSLKEGKHQIEIVAKEKGYNNYLKPVKWNFYIRENRKPIGLDTLIYKTGDTVKDKKTHVLLTGNIILDSRQTNVTGPGKELRQQPPQVNTANINVDLKVGKISFPIRMYQTSDENSKFYAPRGIQSRNYFLTGISHDKFELLYGDQAPTFDRLVLTGMKMRGTTFKITLKRFQMHLVNGEIVRAQEGLYDTSQHVNGIPKYGWVSTKPGEYIKPGDYQRNLNGLRFVFGNKLEGTYLGISILKIKDNFNSIKYGLSPKENLVFGADQTFLTNQSRIKANLGFAYSLFTRDISRPAVTKREIDSALKEDLPIDPYKYKDLFTVNYSTVKPAKNAMSAYINVILKQKYNIVTIDFRYFGGGYTSLGNPYQKVDIRQVSLQDQLYMWKRKMSLTAKYQFQENNRSKSQYSTIYQHLFTTTYLLAPGSKWPQLMVNYMLQNRRSNERITKSLTSNDLYHNLTSTFIYSFKAFKCNHSLNFLYTLNNRVDKLFSFNNNKMTVYSVGLREQINPINISIDIQGTKTISFDPFTKVDLPVNQSVDGRLRYNLKKYKIMFGVGYIYSEMIANSYSLGSIRKTYNFNIIYNGIKNLTLELEGGNSPNINLSFPTVDYTEKYIYARITHALGYKLR